MNIINGSNVFAHHTNTAHESDLGVRAATMKELERTARPGRFAVFTL